MMQGRSLSFEGISKIFASYGPYINNVSLNVRQNIKIAYQNIVCLSLSLSLRRKKSSTQICDDTIRICGSLYDSMFKSFPRMRQYKRNRVTG